MSNNPKSIIIHHSASAPQHTTREAVDEWHRDRGFREIGYHYLITHIKGETKVEIGRNEDENGAHCIGQNTRSIGICVAGSFENPDGTNTDPLSVIPETQWNALVNLCVDICSRYEIAPDRVMGHKETGAATLCPGFDVEPLRTILREIQ